MGLSEFFSTFIPTVYADEEEQPVEIVEEEAPAAEEEVVEEEEEEEEEEEPEDPKEAIMEECAKQCSSLKHHLDECNERVENGSSENCIEEFFHFMHCADECAAPKIFAATK
ncbi:ubiquinol-cytochrome C reductase hinge domain-containing protein [Halteromyces radiatus]|uniref:ubiquinol-cytochrome C reductase hinge domain-containing protein n=1 Tax=Halteromyces radiatus TaxID=101107 RepID=UPI00221F2B85|nr:ubiquinol-cytochrome C reductase hinge domain-containing protein [Halteromyces radiatus]KAI8097526.1 ubiquinol-cytochrome C reductase hinge domain-containing protein [Halteromyces radiatus]